MGVATFRKHRSLRRAAKERPAPDRLADLKARHTKLREELAELGRQIADLTAAEKKAAEGDAPPAAPAKEARARR